jgi:2-oxoglutarate dehydrogenase E2 component (dihydrolipoamide succinyltransferase)
MPHFHMTKERKASGFEPVDFTQHVLMDVLSTARSPDAHAVMLLDMSAAHAFRAAYHQQHGVALTDLHLIIKAIAQTLQHDPQLNSIVRGYRVQQPGSVDIGVSVATGRSVSPVIVMQQAEKKSLRQIRDELQEKSARAVEIEKHASEHGPPMWHKWARLAPGFMRRGVVNAMSRSARLRRSKVGTVHITSVGLADMELYLPTHLGTTTLISVGGTKLRPVVVGNQVEVRPTVYIAFSVDQRVVSAVRSLKTFRRFKRLMENPKLIKDC